MPHKKTSFEPHCPVMTEDTEMCPEGFEYYLCATGGFIGCCSSNPCGLGSACPAANQPVPSISWSTLLSDIAQVTGSPPSFSLGHPQSSTTLSIPIMVSISHSSSIDSGASSQTVLSTTKPTETITIFVPIAPSLSTSTKTIFASSTMMSSSGVLVSVGGTPTGNATPSPATGTTHNTPVGLIIGLTTGVIVMLVGFSALFCALWNHSSLRALNDNEANRLREERDGTPYYGPDQEEGVELQSPVAHPRPVSLRSVNSHRASGDPVGLAVVEVREDGVQVAVREVRWPLASPVSEEDSISAIMMRETTTSMGDLIGNAMRVETSLEPVATLSNPPTPIRQSVSIVNNHSSSSTPSRPRAVSVLPVVDHIPSLQAPSPVIAEDGSRATLLPFTYVPEPPSSVIAEPSETMADLSHATAPQQQKLHWDPADYPVLQNRCPTPAQQEADTPTSQEGSAPFVRLSAVEFVEALDSRPVEEPQLLDAVSAHYVMGKDGLWVRKEPRYYW